MAAKLKVTDKQFLQALELNDGKFTETAGYILRKHGVKITRQAVHERAHRKFELELRSIRRLALNEAATRLNAMVADEGCDVRLRAKVAMHMLTALSKYRKCTPY